jgi:transaldolase
VTQAGIPAIEKRRIADHINAAVCFTLSQCVVAEAVERTQAARAEGKDIATMGPVCTIMVGKR